MNRREVTRICDMLPKDQQNQCVTLIGNQLHLEGDRHVLPGRLALGSVSRAGYARGASPLGPRAAGGFPPKGGHPTPKDPACAHRSPFEQSAQRLGRVVRLASCAAPELFRLGVGVRENVLMSTPVLASLRKISLLSGAKGEGKRTPSGLRPAVGFNGAGAPALMRAPALSCCMGWRP